MSCCHVPAVPTCPECFQTLQLQNEELKKALQRLLDHEDNRECHHSGDFEECVKEVRSLAKQQKSESDEAMVWRACSEHKRHEKVPFKWGPPPWHPCPNCEYRNIVESRETGPETFTEELQACLITPDGKCAAHDGVHATCVTHNRCISECWPTMEPTYGQMKEKRDDALLQVDAIREKCAKIAEACHLSGQGLAPGEDCCGNRIAADIRSSITERKAEPLYLCKNCGRHHWDGPKDCPA